MNNPTTLEDNIFALMEDGVLDMNTAFEGSFGVGKEFASVLEARRICTELGKRYNIAIVTAKSDLKAMKLNLACKHFGEYRSATKVLGVEEKKTENEEDKKTTTKKPYAKDTQRNNCPFLIKFKKSISGGLIVSKNFFGHNHPLPKSRTIYAMHRKQPAEIMKLIMDVLALSGPNPVETVMKVNIKN